MDKWIGATMGTIGFGVSYMIDGIGLAVTVLIAVMAIDFITGVMQAWYNKELSSMIATRGFIRKLYVLLLIGSVNLIEHVILGTSHLSDGVAIAYIAIEFISITENGVKMGAPMPDKIKELLNIVDDKTKELK